MKKILLSLSLIFTKILFCPFPPDHQFISDEIIPYTKEEKAVIQALTIADHGWERIEVPKDSYDRNAYITIFKPFLPTEIKIKRR